MEVVFCCETVRMVRNLYVSGDFGQFQIILVRFLEKAKIVVLKR